MPAIGMRFSDAVAESMIAVIAMPPSGAPKPTSNSRLAGLRTWPVKGFDEFRIYYLVQPELLAVVRVLHDKRDTNALPRRQAVRIAPAPILLTILLAVNQAIRPTAVWEACLLKRGPTPPPVYQGQDDPAALLAAVKKPV